MNVIFIGLPIPKFSKTTHQSSYLITKSNKSENQGKVECSGYSSAYVYRHLGKDVTGQQLYDEMPCKSFRGLVYCRGLVRLAKKYGFDAKLHIGNLHSLKNTVAKGVPVIVMVRTRVGAASLHFISVVGYDEKHIYVADSVASARNANHEHYNRIIPIKEFKKLWNTSLLFQPFYFHIFFDIHEKEK